MGLADGLGVPGVRLGLGRTDLVGLGLYVVDLVRRDPVGLGSADPVGLGAAGQLALYVVGFGRELTDLL